MHQLSIILTVYNTEAYLPRCLDSLVRQKVAGLEIVVVNDGSAGNCRYIVEQYSNNYPEIAFRYIEFPENRGTLAARNAGFAQAGGEYLMTVDSDDWLGANTCGPLLRIIRKHNADILQFPSFDTDGAHNTRLSSSWRKVSARLQGEKILHGFLDKQIPVVMWGKLYQRRLIADALKSLHRFRNQHIVYAEDRLQTMAICLAAKNYRSTCKGAYYYFDNSANAAHKIVLNEQRLKKAGHDIHMVNQGIMQLLKEKNFSADLRDKYINAFMQPESVLLNALRAQPAERFNKLYKYVFKSAHPALAVSKLADHEFIGFYHAVAAERQSNARPKGNVAFLADSLAQDIAARINRWKESFSSFTVLAPLPRERRLRWRQITNEIKRNNIGTLFYYGALTANTIYDLAAMVLNGGTCIIISKEKFNWQQDIGNEKTLALYIHKLAKVVVCASQTDAAIWQQNEVNALYIPGLLQSADEHETFFVPQPHEAWRQLLHYSDNEIKNKITTDQPLSINPLPQLPLNCAAQTGGPQAGAVQGGHKKIPALHKRLRKLWPRAAQKAGGRSHPAIWLCFAPKYFWILARMRSWLQP